MIFFVFTKPKTEQKVILFFNAKLRTVNMNNIHYKKKEPFCFLKHELSLLEIKCIQDLN